MLKTHVSQRGDTLVEVLVAIAVMSAVTVGVLSILNRGIGDVQNASERTSVRALASEQAELLNYFRDQYVDVRAANGDTNAYPASIWTDIKGRAASGGSALTDPSNCNPTTSAFYFEYNPGSSQYETKSFSGSATAAALPSLNNGLWIDTREFQTSVPDAQPYIDFIVKACWNPISSSNVQNLSSAVRLYDR